LVIVAASVRSELIRWPSSRSPIARHVVVGSPQVNREIELIPIASIGITIWNVRRSGTGARGYEDGRSTACVCRIYQICLPICLNASVGSVIHAVVVDRSPPSANGIVAKRQCHRVCGDQVEEHVLREPSVPNTVGGIHVSTDRSGGGGGGGDPVLLCKGGWEGEVDDV